MDTIVNLAIGIPVKVDDDYILVKEVKVKEHTGKDKVEVFGIAKKNPLRAGSEFVSRILVEPKMTPKQVHEQVTVADRDVIICEAFKATRGNIITFPVTCGNRQCLEKLNLEINLNDLSCKIDEKEVCVLIDSEMRFVFNDDIVGEIIIKYPTGSDIEKIRKIINKNELEAMYKLYSICMRKYGDKEGGFGEDFIRDLPLSQIDAVEMYINENTFGYQRSDSASCHFCGSLIDYEVDILSFFFLNPQKKRI